jgi:transcription termination factor Rho
MQFTEQNNHETNQPIEEAKQPQAKTSSYKPKRSYGQKNNHERSSPEAVHASKPSETIDINVEIDPNIPREVMKLSDIKNLALNELISMATDLAIENPNRLRKHDLIFMILKQLVKKGAIVQAVGVLEILSDGFGFLRSPETSYLASHDDIYVSPSQIRRFSLHTGDTIEGEIRMPKEGEKYFALVRVDVVNARDPMLNKNKVLFENLTPLFPTKQLYLERDIAGEDNYTGRVIDIIAPLGAGQRALIVAPPKTGKTVILKHIAQSINANHPDIVQIVLLIDERPEEVTDMQRSVNAEVVASTFDELPSRHVQVAEMVLEKAKRLVESGKDVLIILDSITRLARAYNTVSPASGKILTGGIDANALHKPKKFFGSARNIEEGGSLTIIASALIDTGSRMDDVIYEEFKGTGNMELHLDRDVAQRCIYPAVDVMKSGTRRHELLLTPVALQRMKVLRRFMAEQSSLEASLFLLKKIHDTKSNAEFFDNMVSS